MSNRSAQKRHGLTNRKWPTASASKKRNKALARVRREERRANAVTA